MDFSRNFGSELGLHGEFSLINDFTNMVVDSNGTMSQTKYTAVNYLMGLRYLTKQDTTYILEYYHNNTGYRSKEMRDYFFFIDNGYAMYTLRGNAAMLNKAINLGRNSYGRTNPGMNYLYPRISQEDPFDIPHWTPCNNADCRY